MDTLPLAGVKVVDFTAVQAGPACTQLLAWFGADVLKIEHPGGGDIFRRQLRDIPDVDSLCFTMFNSNKRSITVDAKTPEGLEIMEKLIRGAVGSPIKFSDFTPDIVESPLLGEHTDQVLADLGYDAAQIARLHAEQVV